MKALAAIAALAFALPAPGAAEAMIVCSGGAARLMLVPAGDPAMPPMPCDKRACHAATERRKGCSR